MYSDDMDMLLVVGTNVGQPMFLRFADRGDGWYRAKINTHIANDKVSRVFEITLGLLARD